MSLPEGRPSHPREGAPEGLKRRTPSPGLFLALVAGFFHGLFLSCFRMVGTGYSCPFIRNSAALWGRRLPVKACEAWGQARSAQVILQVFWKVYFFLSTFAHVSLSKSQPMKCPKCGHKVDLNTTIKKLREKDAKLARAGHFHPPNPELYPLHYRVKLHGDKLPELVARFCAMAQVRTEDVFGLSRLKEFVIPRHVLMWWIAENSHHTLAAIARMFGRHHATVVHAKKSVENSVAVQDPLVMFHVDLINDIAPQVWPALNATPTMASAG